MIKTLIIPLGPINIYTSIYLYLPVDIHEKDLLNTVALLAAFFLAPFIPLPPLSSFRPSSSPDREETNLNRNGPAAGSSSSVVELHRVFVRTPFVCRARGRQFRARNLGDRARTKKGRER